MFFSDRERARRRRQIISRKPEYISHLRAGMSRSGIGLENPDRSTKNCQSIRMTQRIKNSDDVFVVVKKKSVSFLDGKHYLSTRTNARCQENRLPPVTESKWSSPSVLWPAVLSVAVSELKIISPPSYTWHRSELMVAGVTGVGVGVGRWRQPYYKSLGNILQISIWLANCHSAGNSR